MPLEDEDFADFAVLSLLSSTTPATGLDPIPLRLDGAEGIARPYPGATLTVRGFPGAAPQSTIDYDSKAIRLQAAVFDAKATGFNAVGGKGSLEFVKNLPLTDLGGLSGSPVFLQSKVSPVLVRYELCGLLIQASALKGHYIPVSLIVTALSALSPGS
jgi:hypothetical protein